MAGGRTRTFFLSFMLPFKTNSHWIKDRESFSNTNRRSSGPEDQQVASADNFSERQTKCGQLMHNCSRENGTTKHCGRKDHLNNHKRQENTLSSDYRLRPIYRPCGQVGEMTQVDSVQKTTCCSSCNLPCCLAHSALILSSGARGSRPSTRDIHRMLRLYV